MRASEPRVFYHHKECIKGQYFGFDRFFLSELREKALCSVEGRFTVCVAGDDESYRQQVWSTNRCVLSTYFFNFI